MEGIARSQCHQRRWDRARSYEIVAGYSRHIQPRWPSANIGCPVDSPTADGHRTQSAHPARARWIQILSDTARPRLSYTSRRVHRLFTGSVYLSTAPLPAKPSCFLHGRPTRSTGHLPLRSADARPHLGVGAGMTVVQGILLAVSVAVFIYLGIAMFKPEWF